MRTLVECVPNFSEGRDRGRVKTITDAISAVEGITLLDVDPGPDTNRTVVTLVGPLEVVEEAAFRAIQSAAAVIDMRHHRGAHARLGATDVCPFIPIRGVTVEDCVALSERVGQRVAGELEIPVYLYENSARSPQRRNLAAIRQGEYEGLEEKLKDPHWAPDFGPAHFNPATGATVIGAREFLIAYNINLSTRDKRLAQDIAFELREKGRSQRQPHPDSPNLLDGEIVRYAEGHYPCAFCELVAPTVAEIVEHHQGAHDHDLRKNWQDHGYREDQLAGKAVKQPGMFKAIKAVGWYMETYNRAQISINFTNYKVTPVHTVFDAAGRLATERGVRVTGSELVGLIPLEAVLMAGRHYLKQQRRTAAVPQGELIETAVQSLGLGDVTGFDPREKIIEYAVEDRGADLTRRSTVGLVDEVSTDSPAPGGGSVAALAGSLGSALVSMVAALTHKKKGFEDLRSELETIGQEAQELKDRLVELVDEDTRAFQEVLEANRRKASTPEETRLVAAARQQALDRAIQVPLEVAELSWRALELSAELVRVGNPGSISDAGVAGEVALAGVRGAAMNVLINLSSLEDRAQAQTLESRVKALIKQAEKLQRSVFSATLRAISSS